MKIIKFQTGEFTRAKGKEVMEQFLKSPAGKDINVVYAHNDDINRIKPHYCEKYK